MNEDTPRSYTSPRDDRFFTPRNIARSNSASNSDEWQTPRDFQSPRSIYETDRRDSGRKDSSRSNPNSSRTNPLSARDYYDAMNNNHSNYSQSKDTYNVIYDPGMKQGYTQRAQPKIGYIAEEYEEEKVYDKFNVDSIGFTEEDIENLFSYARHGRCEEIDRQLDQGIPVDIRDEYGNTLLIIACQNGNKRVAKAVLRRGASLNVRNHKGNTPLHYCYQYGYGETLGQYLISKVSKYLG